MSATAVAVMGTCTREFLPRNHRDDLVSLLARAVAPDALKEALILAESRAITESPTSED